MSFPPSVADFKALFTRDFLYGSGGSTISDGDIQRAINQAGITFNPGLWDGVTPLGSTTELSVVYLYVSAHYMVLNIQAAGGLSAVNRGRGVKSQGGGWTQSKGAGPLNVAYAISDRLRDDPILSPFMRTDYGQQYLMFLEPRIVGNVAIVSGVAPQGGNILGLMAVQTLTITTLSLPAGTHAVAYSQTVRANGGVGVYAWTVSSGSLPTGLTIGLNTGILSGTPSVAGTYYFELTATDAVGHTAAMNYQVVIA